MKKIFLASAVTSLGIASVFSGAIQATGTYEQSVIDCLVNSQEPVCSIDRDIVLTDPIIIPADRTVTFDLGGYNVTANKSGFSAPNIGLLAVSNGAELTLKGTGKVSTDGTGVYAAVALTHKTTYNSEKTAKLIIDGPTVEGFYYGVVGNGSRHNTSITLNSGRIEGLNSDINDGSFGIYQPQTGSITINGGVVTGFDGIGMKSGELTINGGQVLGTGEVEGINQEGYNNGINANGAGIQIESNTSYIGDIDVRINGGSVESSFGYGILEFRATSAQPETSNLKNISISQGSIYGKKAYNQLSETAGILTVENGSVISENSTEKIVVTKIANIDGLTEGQEVRMILQDGATFDNQEESDQYDAVTELKDYTIGSIFDIKVCKVGIADCEGVNQFGHTTPLDNPLTFSLDLSEIALTPVADGYTREYAIVHVTSDKAEIIPSSLSRDGKTLTFSASEFSSYALVYKDTKAPSAPKAGFATNIVQKASNSAGLITYSITGAMIASIFAIVHLKRRR